MNLNHDRALPFASMEGLDVAGLNGLDGWGKIKKKLKLNKLKTRKLVGKVAKVVPGAALLVPTKKTLKAAGQGMAVGAAIGSVVIGGPKAASAIYKIAKTVKDKQAQGAAAAQAEAEIERQAQEYEAALDRQDAAPSYSAPSYSTSGAGGNAAAAATEATTTAAKPATGWAVPATLATLALMALGA